MHSFKQNVEFSYSEKNIELSETDNEIFFKREQGGYELVLQKNEHSGKWERPVNN